MHTNMHMYNLFLKLSIFLLFTSNILRLHATYVYKNQNEVLLLLCFYYYALFKSKAENEKPNGLIWTLHIFKLYFRSKTI